MTDCGNLFSQIAVLQARIEIIQDDLDDPNVCDRYLPRRLDNLHVCEVLKSGLESEITDLTVQLQSLQAQVKPICNLLIGQWRIDANGSEGQLTIDHVDSITGQSLKGTVKFTDQEAGDDIEGSWDDTAKIIKFRLGPHNPVFQDYTGFLGDNHADQFVILAGSFTQSDVPAGTPRSQFGWFAQKP